jgi:hypothetical protein
MYYNFETKNTMDEKYFFISSDDNKDKFPHNKAHMYTISLPDVIVLPNKPNDWCIGLIDLAYTSKNILPFGEYIDIRIGEIIYNTVHGKLSPIVRRVINTNTSGVNSYISFNPVIYIPVNVKIITSISILILNSAELPADHLIGTTFCTLHLKKSK